MPNIQEENLESKPRTACSKLPDRHSEVRVAIAALAAGEMIMVLDDAGREDEADLVMAASSVTAAQMSFLVRHTTGIVCAPMSEAQALRLALPPMVRSNTDPHQTAFTVSVDHRDAGTGVSASNRCVTLRALARETTRPQDLQRPGHIFPLVAADGGVLERRGHTEAAVDLLKLADVEPVGVISELVADDGDMMRGAAAQSFAAEHALPVVTVSQIAMFRRARETTVRLLGKSKLPTPVGRFNVDVYLSTVDQVEHLVLSMERTGAGTSNDLAVPLVRVHSECLTGDVLGSLRCDCGEQLSQSMQAIAAEGAGTLIYLRGQEGRGIGLLHKIQAYALQDQGLDTVDANSALGLPVDDRSYDAAAHILRHRGVTAIRLITNNPQKIDDLESAGIDVVERVALPANENKYNHDYLTTKRERMGHLLPLTETA